MTGQKRSMSLNCSKNHQKASDLELGVSIQHILSSPPRVFASCFLGGCFFFGWLKFCFMCVAFSGCSTCHIQRQTSPQKLAVGGRSFPVGKFYFQGL